MLRESMNWLLGHGEPGDDVDWSEGRQLDVLVVRRRLGVLHLVVGCVVVSRKVTSLEAVDLLTLTPQRLRTNSQVHTITGGFSYIFIRVLTRLYFGGFLAQLLPHHTLIT